jgi:hypothetical protein
VPPAPGRGRNGSINGLTRDLPDGEGWVARETATAIQAHALALSASRSARHGALSFRPPAAMYCFAILPSERQFSEVSYLSPLSRTSITHRLTAALNDQRSDRAQTRETSMPTTT